MDPFIRTEIVRLNRQLAALLRRGRTEQAARTAVRICDVVRQNLGEDDPLLVAALVALGDVCAAGRDFQAAERHYHQAILTGQRVWGEEHRSLVSLLERQARVKVALGKQAEASSLHDRAVEIRRRAVAQEDPASPRQPVESSAGLSTRGGAGTGLGGGERGDDALRTTVAPLPALSERGPCARLGDLCRSLLARARRRDVVESSVFAPAEAAPGQLFFVQVFAHRPGQRQEAEREAARADRQSQLRGRRSLKIEIPRGAELLFHLSIPGLEVEQAHESLVWRGRPEAAQFAVRVPEGHPAGTVIGTVTTSMGRVPLGHVKFKLTVTTGVATPAPGLAEQVGDDARRYRRAFVSYASADRAEVIKRVAMLRVARIRVFQDVLNIEPGERWQKKLYDSLDRCDLFLLFWSSAAKSSEWVRKEVHYAHERKQKDELSPPEIVPVILEVPPPLPPPELSHLQFNDWMMYLAQDAASGPAASPAAPQ